MKKITLSCMALTLLLSSSFVFAHDHKEAKTTPAKTENKNPKQCDMKNGKECCTIPNKSNSAFSQLKTIAGSWSGAHEMNGKKETFNMNYRITAGGSALLETIGAGTEKEMISVYTGPGELISMTHYCLMGNQPSLILDSYENNVFHFKHSKTKGIKTNKEMYMGELTITLKDKNHMTQKWVASKKGKPVMTSEIELTRK